MNLVTGSTKLLRNATSLFQKRTTMLRASETFPMVSRNYYNTFSNRNNTFPQLRRFQQTSSRTKTSNTNKNQNPTMATAAGVVVVTVGVAQIALGNTNDTFFEHKLIVKNVDPDDLADFFGTEAAMEAFSIFPFVTNFLMRRGVWDDEGTYRVPILLGDYLSARIEFDDEDLPPAKPKEDLWEKFMVTSTKPGEEEDDDDDEDEEEEDDNLEDKEVEAGSVEGVDNDEEDEDEEEESKSSHFGKKETFRLVEKHIQKAFFHYELEMGYNLLPNSKDCEIYYRGLKFSGLFPFRLFFQIHAHYYMWAMKRYFHSDPFACLDDLTEEAEHYRSNIPVAVMKEYLHDLIRDVEHARQMAKAKKLSTEAHEETIEDIQKILRKAGYLGAEAVLVDASDEEGKQKVLLQLSDKKSMATIQRALTLHSETKENIPMEKTKQSGAAGVNLAKKMTLRIQEEIKNGSQVKQ